MKTACTIQPIDKPWESCLSLSFRAMNSLPLQSGLAYTNFSGVIRTEKPWIQNQHLMIHPLFKTAASAQLIEMYGHAPSPKENACSKPHISRKYPATELCLQPNGRSNSPHRYLRLARYPQLLEAVDVVRQATQPSEIHVFGRHPVRPATLSRIICSRFSAIRALVMPNVAMHASNKRKTGIRPTPTF